MEINPKSQIDLIFGLQKKKIIQTQIGNKNINNSLNVIGIVKGKGVIV